MTGTLGMTRIVRYPTFTDISYIPAELVPMYSWYPGYDRSSARIVGYPDILHDIIRTRYLEA